MIEAVIIGAGNVATHLAPALDGCEGVRVGQVWSRSLQSASAIAHKLDRAIAIDSLESIDRRAGLYVISLPDAATIDIAAKISHIMRLDPGHPWQRAMWVHTSGSLPMETLNKLSPRHGVFYPLQTFSRQVDLNMAQVPFFIEASEEPSAASLQSIAREISPRVYRADSEQRKRMHIAAVFACNFTNYMFTVADDLLRADNLDLGVLGPLLAETVRKALAGNPAEGQTGPAVRGDASIVKAHERMLPSELASIYRQLSSAIYKRHFPDVECPF